MSILAVPGAQLYFETHGAGPSMIMIPGAAGTGDVFRRVTEHLSSHYTVVIYDRRGFSRSLLEDSQDYVHRLDTEADDVRRLIEHLGGEPATVFGNSSGAIVALQVLVRHPSAVRVIVPHEPPAMKALNDGQEWIDFFSGVYDLYHESGIEPALAAFRERAFPQPDQRAMANAPRNEYTLPNARHWFEHELRQYPAVDLDLDALRVNADRIVLASGRASRGYPSYEASAGLAAKLGLRLIELPGGHVGFLSEPVEFADALRAALEGRGSDERAVVS